MQFIHDRLHDARGVGRRSMAVDPALGMHHIAHAVADAAYHVAALFELCHERINLRFIGKELDIMTRRPAEVAAAEFLGDVAHLADIVGAHETAGSNTHGMEFIPGLGNMFHVSFIDHFMVLPLPVVLRDHGRQEFMVVR